MNANQDNRKDFESLHSAALQVDESLRHDDNLSGNSNATSDLKDLLQAPRSGAVKYYIRSPTKITDNTQAMGASENRVQQIEETLCIPIPQGIREQLRQRDDIIASFTGILPEINRVWITIDNVLYFWNYLYGDDYLVYEGLQEVVYSVTTVCPRADTFNDNVAYLLVVVTPVEVTLLAVVKGADIADQNGVFQIQSIQPTKYTVPSDNLTFLSVVGSSTGRIFLAGSDCNLYEFEYKNEESSWSYLLGIGPDFSCKKRKYNCGGTVYSFFSFLSSEDDVLQDLVVDDVRRLLYAISKLGKINIFYLPPDATPKMIIGANVIEKAKMKRTAAIRLKHDDVHSIFVIPVEESDKLHGVVVLSSGIRIYFSIKARSFPFNPQIPESNVTPTDFEVEHIRLPVQPEQIEALKRANHSQDEGFPAGLPNADPNSRRRLSKALYSYGSYFTALEETSNSENILINAKMEWTGTTVREDNSYELKENLCALRHSEDGTLFVEKVEDIKEACNHLFDLNTSKLNRLFFASKPDQYNPSGTSTAKRKAKMRSELEPVPGAAPCLPYLSRSVGYGYDNDDLQSLHRQTELSFQMLPSLAHTKRQFLVLTNRALHVVTQRRPIDYLYALLQIGVDERALCEGINRRLFDYYGLSQCSAMCVAIACDLPCDISSIIGEDRSFSVHSEVHESLKRNAIAVMKELGNVHAPLLPIMNAPSTNSSVVNPFQQQSQTSEHSTTFYALYQVFSRIMRPIWYRVFVQMRVLDGRNIFLPILDTYELEAIKRPLQKLVDILRHWHQDAVDSQGNTSMNKSIGGIAKPSRGVPTGISSQRYRENEARLAENKALNSFYRLLTRTYQAVNLMQILIEADEDYKLRVEWERMYDNDDAWTFKKIVTMGDYHDKIKSVLKDLVCVNDASRNAVGRTDTEYITKKLATECFQYFSVGDVHHYKGSNELNRALAAPHNSHERDQHTIAAIDEMCKAAVYWRSMVDVSTINNVVSPLESTCNLLLNLGEIGQEGIVSVCMSCARGFGGGDNDGQVLSITTQSSWEENLYHSGSVSTVEDRYKAKKACYEALIHRIAQVQEREFMAVGAGVTNHTADVVQATDRNVKVMINKAIDITKDLDFHKMLYNFLISNQLDDYLLTLDTVYVENYLAEKDKMKLYQYYELHKRYYEAMELMTKLATIDEPTSLIFRIDCLAKAVRSADSACRNPDLRHPRNTVDALNDRTDRLRMAEFQLKLAEILDGKAEEATRLRDEADRSNVQGVVQMNDPNMRRLQDLIFKVKNTLMTDDEMFKEITVPFDLWEESLEIIHGCNHEDESLVKTLWRSIIFSIIPTYSNVPELRRFIEEWRRLHDNIFVDRMRENPGILLEHTDGYMQELGVKIRDLGKILNADDGGGVFPLVMLIEDLEKLVITLNRRIGFTLRTFTMDIFRGIGIKHSILMEAYVSTARRQNLSSSNNWDLVQLAWAASDLVIGWTKLANSHGPSEEVQTARTSLRMEIRSGRMRQWLKNGLRDSIQRAESLLYNGDAQYISNLKEAKDKIDEAIDATDLFALG